MSGELIREGKHYEIRLTNEPFTEEFSKHKRVFQIFHKKYQTCAAEGVNHAQAQQTLQMLDAYEDEIEEQAVEAPEVH